MTSSFVKLHIALILAAASISAVAQETAPRTQIDSGVLVGASINGVNAFKGIPYAAPPIGDLRWAPPQRPASWNGERDATQFGAMCPQPGGMPRMVSGPGYDFVLDAPANPLSKEDCLILNVWSPAAAKNAPVLLWIHGGSGAGSLPMYDGSGFARDGVVTVTINYRLLTLGHFAHASLTKASQSDEQLADEPLGRYSLMDQIAALQWVKRNIAAFGGDPNNVTVAGHSAGGAGIFYLLTVPKARGLFHKAIVQSGGGWVASFSLRDHEKVGAMLATKVGLPGEQATVEQLRSIPVESIPGFGAHTIDGRWIRESFTDAIAGGRMADVPLMIGWTDFDGSSVRGAPSEIVAAAPPAVAAAYADEGKTGDDLGYAMYTDLHVAAPARWVAKQASAGAPAFLYQFSYVHSSRQGKVRGVQHGGELQFVFDSWQAGAPSTDADRAVTKTTHCYWVGFVKTGVPQCAGAPEWPRYTASDDRIMDLGAAPQVRRHYRKRQLDAQEAAMPEIIKDKAESIRSMLDSDLLAPTPNASK